MLVEEGAPVNWVEVEVRQLLVVGGERGEGALPYWLSWVVAEQILKSLLHQLVGRPCIRSCLLDRGRLSLEAAFIRLRLCPVFSTQFIFFISID